ncbi:LysR family transcriptional regulator [Paenibacillus sp. tmac-D7]|uniref:LysR family transcriptional regulator n=1 Tax=Paenibacillus sp. tmac-D7 TaxID=2591462 RepID=UPI0015E861E5|nr:LysR family transcriptional regulator [Paenibacillus sp. tmac-D7]
MRVPPLEIDLLKTFQRVVTSGSISKTAEDMYLSVSTVTGRIKALEDKVGVPLFVRTGRRIELTDAGAAFVAYVERFMDLIEEGRSRIHARGMAHAGHLNIAATPFFTSYMLPDMIRRFAKKFPKVRLKLSACSNSQVLSLVTQGKADIGMVQEQPQEKGLVRYPLLRDPVIPVVPKGHPLTRLEAIGPEDAASCPILGFDTRSEPWSLLEQWFARHRLVLRVHMEFDHPETLKRYLQPFGAIAFLPGLTVAEELESGDLVSLRMAPPPDIRSSLFMVSRSEASNHAQASQAFMEFALREAAEIAGGAE